MCNRAGPPTARALLKAKLAAKDDLLGFVAEPAPVINCANGELWIAQDGSVELRPHRPESYLRHCLDKPDDSVERRAQLVAHAGHELRLVLACQLELAALLADLAEQTRILDRQRRIALSGQKAWNWPNEVRVELSSRREQMPDDLTNKGPQDRNRISLLEPHEVQYWAEKFNVSKERLSEAVKNVGHSAAVVEKELKRLA